MGRQMHRNGVECIHGLFLHEKCEDCRIEELKPYLKHHRDCPQPTDITINDIGIDTSCTCGLDKILMEGE